MGADLPRQDLPSLFRTGRGSLEHPHLSRASGYLPTGVPGEPSRKRDLFRLRKNEPDQVLFLREKPTKCFESVNFFPKHAIIIGDYAQEKDRRMKELIDLINQFRDERDWRKFHNEKDLAISISLEASELLELFQWKQSEEVVEKSLQEIREELADVFMYSFMLADNLNLDVEEIIKEKIDINSKKYPVELSKGNNKKYTDLEKK